MTLFYHDNEKRSRKDKYHEEPPVEKKKKRHSREDSYEAERRSKKEKKHKEEKYYEDDRRIKKEKKHKKLSEEEQYEMERAARKEKKRQMIKEEMREKAARKKKDKKKKNKKETKSFRIRITTTTKKGSDPISKAKTNKALIKKIKDVVGDANFSKKMIFKSFTKNNSFNQHLFRRLKFLKKTKLLLFISLQVKT